MEAHFKLGSLAIVSPRLQLHDDTANTGKVFVGYTNPHLRTEQTNCRAACLSPLQRASRERAPPTSSTVPRLRETRPAAPRSDHSRTPDRQSATCASSARSLTFCARGPNAPQLRTLWRRWLPGGPSGLRTPPSGLRAAHRQSLPRQARELARPARQFPHPARCARAPLRHSRVHDRGIGLSLGHRCFEGMRRRRLHALTYTLIVSYVYREPHLGYYCLTWVIVGVIRRQDRRTAWTTTTQCTCTSLLPSGPT